MEVRRAVLGDAHVDRAIERTTPFTEDFQDLITRYAWGEIWSRPGSRPANAQLHHADGARRARPRARARDARPRCAAQRPHAGRDRRGAPPVRRLLRRAGRELAPSRSRSAVLDEERRRHVTRAVVLSAVRTPVGRYGGGLAGVRPDDLAAIVIAEAVERAGVPAAEIEDVWLGCANQAGRGQPQRRAVRGAARGAARLGRRRHRQPALRVRPRRRSSAPATP